MNGSPYTYRIVEPNGEPIRLAPQGGDLDGCVQRLQAILDDPSAPYPKGWVERRPDHWEAFRIAQTPHRGQSDRCTCDPDADGTTDLFCPVHGDSVSLPLTNTVEDEERASWADREPDDPPS